MISVPRYVWVVVFYIAWIAAHYAATHAYVKYCTPNTFWGFIMSPFIASTPHCEGFRWVISAGGLNIAKMWTIAGVWVKSNIAYLIWS
jgi:hypothetical protein